MSGWVKADTATIVEAGGSWLKYWPRAPADGHTVLFVSTPFAQFPNVLLVAAKSPIGTVK